MLFLTNRVICTIRGCIEQYIHNVIILLRIGGGLANYITRRRKGVVFCYRYHYLSIQNFLFLLIKWFLVQNSRLYFLVCYLFCERKKLLKTLIYKIVSSKNYRIPQRFTFYSFLCLYTFIITFEKSYAKYGTKNKFLCNSIT